MQRNLTETSICMPRLYKTNFLFYTLKLCHAVNYAVQIKSDKNGYTNLDKQHRFTGK